MTRQRKWLFWLAGFSLLLSATAAPLAAAPCFPLPQYLGAFERYAPNSPFYRNWVNFTNLFWFYGKRNGVDPRLLLAISGQETRFATDPAASTCINRLNPWGIMDCSGTRCTCRTFRNWDEAINFASRLLGLCYIAGTCMGSDGPRPTIPLIAQKYCPPAQDPRCRVWPDNVRRFYRGFGGLAFPNGAGDRLQWAGGCCIDCDGNGFPTISDAVVATNILMGRIFNICPTLDLALDPNDPWSVPDGGITVDELLAGVNEILSGCPGPN